MAFVGYARVSTLDQDLTLQLEALNGSGCEKIFHGKQSGASKQNEDKLGQMLEYIREGDTVLVTKLDRLGRSLKSILETIESIHQKGAKLKTLDGVIDTSAKSPFAKATVSLLGVFAQLERDLIVSRTGEGRALAKKMGKRLGRNKTISDKDRESIRKRLKAGESKSALSREFAVSRTTIGRICTEKS